MQHSYRVLGKAGEGAHGVVLRAVQVETGRLVALKKVSVTLPARLARTADRRDHANACTAAGAAAAATCGGVASSVLREIKALQILGDHSNIVKLLDVFPSGPYLTLCFEYMPADMAELLRNAATRFTTPRIRHYMRQLLAGVSHLHAHAIMHRDLKPANLLVSSNGVVKIADFGLARVHARKLNVMTQARNQGAQHSAGGLATAFDEVRWSNQEAQEAEFACTSRSATPTPEGRGTRVVAFEVKGVGVSTPNKTSEALAYRNGEDDNFDSRGVPYSHQVATRWYRAPELLYGSRFYDESVDLWAVGCIFGEMYNQSPLFPGINDIDQLSVVITALGTPTKANWPDVETLPDWNKIHFGDMPGVPLDQIVPDLPSTALDLLSRMLIYDSKKRISAAEALLHDYFSEKDTLFPIIKESEAAALHIDDAVCSCDVPPWLSCGEAYAGDGAGEDTANHF